MKDIALVKALLDELTGRSGELPREALKEMMRRAMEQDPFVRQQIRNIVQTNDSTTEMSISSSYSVRITNTTAVDLYNEIIRDMEQRT